MPRLLLYLYYQFRDEKSMQNTVCPSFVHERNVCSGRRADQRREAQKKPDPAQNAGDRLLLPYDYSYRSQSGSAVRRIQYS